MHMHMSILSSYTLCERRRRILWVGQRKLADSERVELESARVQCSACLLAYLLLVRQLFYYCYRLPVESLTFFFVFDEQARIRVDRLFPSLLICAFFSTLRYGRWGDAMAGLAR